MSTTPRPSLSILDLVGVSEGQSMAEAIEVSMTAAEMADEQGYSRLWYAEHHNTRALASNATTLLMDRAASRTSRIRIGSGGIMLPNHSPLQVIEQFGTLVQFHGDRIDLGLGRAPGTDPLTSQLLWRGSADPENFERSVADMQAWASQNTTARHQVGAYIAEGTEVPMWVLGSSEAGAKIAAHLGLPFAVASHFAPYFYEQAINRYRHTFNASAPTAQSDTPRTMVGVNVVVAPTDAEAQRQYSTLEQLFASISMGKRSLVQPPVDTESVFTPRVLDHVRSTLQVRAVGSPRTVVEQLESLAQKTKADEFIVTGYFFDPEDRFTSQRLLAEAWFE